jgi:hypothetical protein
MSAGPEQKSWRAVKRAAVRNGGRPAAHGDSGEKRPAGWWTQADIDYARDFVARQRTAGMLDAPTPPGRALHARPPSPDGEGEEKTSLHDSVAVKKGVDGRDKPGHDENKECAPPAPPAPVERPWIPAAVRAQMGHIDPRFPVPRIIEETWPDERAPRTPQLQERAWRSPREAEEHVDANGWRIVR